MRYQSALFVSVLLSASIIGFQSPLRADSEIVDPEAQKIVEGIDQAAVQIRQWQQDLILHEQQRENQLYALCMTGQQSACAELQLFNNRLERSLQLMK